MSHRITLGFRAVIVKIVLLICLAVLIASCGNLNLPFDTYQVTALPTPTVTNVPTPTPMVTPTPVPTLPLPRRYQESPMLEAMARSGEIAPLKERLPERPKVVPVVERIGQYGGAWRMVIQPIADDAQFLRTVAYEPLVRWTSDWSGIEPNLVESYTFNTRATEFSFTLRRGLRWSDGEPFTTEDIRFFYEDVLLNKELTPVIPAWLRSHTEPAKFEFIDSLSFKVIFTFPNSLFLQHLATPDALMITAFPAHYLRQFHAAYADPAALDKMVKDGGYASWADMFVKRVGVNSTDHGNFIDPDRPRLSAWVLKTPYTAEEPSVTWQRNPYYWKVDPAGNQLPYLDAVVFRMVNNQDEAINQVIAGEIDMQNLRSLGVDVESVLAGRTNSDYTRYSLVESSNNVMVINLNLASQDLVKREIFQNKDFRIGLSYAINRQEILDFLYQGRGLPWQAAPPEGSLFYDYNIVDMGTQFTEYSPEKASEYFDKAGFLKDQVGNRLGPDGLPITINIEVLDSEPQQIAMLNMIAKYWAEVGIKLLPKIESLPIFMATVHSNLHDAAAWTGGATLFYDVMLDPNNYLPSSANAFWAVTWASWYNRVPGFENQQPNNAARQAVQMYDSIRASNSLDKQVSLMRGALIIARESFWTIGIALLPEPHGILRKSFMNVPAQMPAAWLYPDPAPTNPEQYFIAP